MFPSLRCDWLPELPVLGRYFTNTVALLFAILLGNTFNFLYNQRLALTTQLYMEVVCLNNFLEETLLECEHCRVHIRATFTDPQQVTN